ncbi:cyd operon protein YbgE [Vibrio sp. Of7-15]|uniref:cyd operon protein YbgE n=1 Tax=Vibrio sp. Of7-15 TaxID=2724879 RepID=UPI001EF30BE3|nr:cyd operon protein YbgE [Vibrio sp. Of7-15]
MSSITGLIEKLHQPLDNIYLRGLSIVLAVWHAGLLMWSPIQYAEAVGGFSGLMGPALVWGVCASFVYGIGFKPRFWLWQVFFSPYFSLVILIGLSVLQLDL